jgi:hypothetical protein
MSEIKGMVVDLKVEGRLAIDPAPAPIPQASQPLVGVKVISLNFGEVRRALTLANAGWRPG